MTTISIIQPSFLPWLGYFEQMATADIFVHFDDVQYTRKDWRNRNRLKTPSGVRTITVPVGKHEYGKTLINEISIGFVPQWQEKLLQQITSWYKPSSFYNSLFPELQSILLEPYSRLVDINYALTNFLRKHLEIDTPQFFSSRVAEKPDDKNLKIISICKYFGADILYDGQAAKSFIDLDLFMSHGIRVIFQDYHCCHYPQLWGGFESHLSALDLLFNCGSSSSEIMRSKPHQNLA